MNNLEALKKLSAEATEMISGDSSLFDAWHKKCEIVISRQFGEKSTELKQFRDIRFSPIIFSTDTPDSEFTDCLNKGLLQAVALINFLSDETSDKKSDDKQDKNTVFIVHGHDGELKYKTATLLFKLGLKYIILHEQKNLGDTIIEKLERCGTKARAAIVLFTPDDFGQAKTEEERQKRARQNVVFEAGYFIGKLGRSNVICVVSDKSIELPGDLSGVVYSDAHGDSDIVRELKAMGFKIDANKLYDN